MKAMLEPRIVAPSIHGPDFATHGAPPFPERATVSSHGVFIERLMFRATGYVLTLLLPSFKIPGRQQTHLAVSHRHRETTENENSFGGKCV
jgi:hypothetical protein